MPSLHWTRAGTVPAGWFAAGTVVLAGLVVYGILDSQWSVVALATPVAALDVWDALDRTCQEPPPAPCPRRSRHSCGVRPRGLSLGRLPVTRQTMRS